MKTEDILNLVLHHYSGNDDAFTDALKGMIDSEAAADHYGVSRKLREHMNRGLDMRKSPRRFLRLDDIAGNRSDIAEKVETSFSPDDIVMAENIRSCLNRIAREYRFRDKLMMYGIDCRRKILLYGPSGTGKTMTGGVLASVLQLPFYVVRTENIITSLLGQSSSNIASLFGRIKHNPGVYLLDEFDSLGSSRLQEGNKDVAEMRRITNTFLQYLEADRSPSVILCATNMSKILDFALFRRFDDVIEYRKPDDEQIVSLIEKLTKQRLADIGNVRSSEVVENCRGMSFANIKAAVLNTLKDAILEDRVDENGNISIEAENLIGNIVSRRESVEKEIEKHE